MKLKKALSYVLAFAMIMTCISFTPVTPRVKAESEPDYLTFTSDQAFTVKLTKGLECSAEYYLEYSLDKENWFEFRSNVGGEFTVYEADADSYHSGKYAIYFRNKEGVTNSSFASSYDNYGGSVFSFEPKSGVELEVKASGNIMTLLDYQNPDEAEMGEYAFAAMFYECTSLTEAPELPATTLANYCYANMFYACTSLTETPKLPATTLKEGCYEYMFNSCVSLTEAPELPAKTLADYCYFCMFACTSLTKAPELPAEKLANSCYNNMFNSCDLLTEAPELKATELAYGCYYAMFNGCSHLYITKLGDSTGAKWSIPASEVESPVEDMITDTAAGSDEIEVPSTGTNYYKVVGVFDLNSKSTLEGKNVTFKVGGTAVTQAAEGQVVTVTADNAEGYTTKLEGVYGANNSQLDINEDGTFTMPKGAVTVKARYTSTHTFTSYEIIEGEESSEIKATCSDDVCAFSEKSISIGLDVENTEYDGNQYSKASIVNKDAWEDAGLDVPEIKYYEYNSENEDYDELESAPTNAGNYKAKITVGQCTVSNEFEIAKAQGSGTVSIEGWTYGESENTPSLIDNTNTGASVTYNYREDTLAYVPTSSEVPTVAGDYSVSVDVGETDNYYGYCATGYFTIKKADNTISNFKCADIDLGNAPEPSATAASGDAVTFTYSKSETGEFKTWDEIADGAGTYYVKATSAKTDNYNSKEEVKSFAYGIECIAINECEVQNGTFNLKLGDKEYGKVKLTKSGTGWALYSEDEQKYIYWDGSNVIYSDTAYVWSYNKGFYVTKSTETKILFWTFTKKKNYYLSFDGSNLSATTGAVTAVLTKEVKNTSHSYNYRYNGDGTHTYYCTDCEKEFGTENCEYGENGLCKYCGHLNPENVSFTVDVNVTSKTTKATGWKKFFSRSSKTTYTAKITATCTGDELETVEYSIDNVNFKEGMTYSSSSEITTLYICVTAANGASKTFLYQDGTVTPVGQYE